LPMRQAKVTGKLSTVYRGGKVLQRRRRGSGGNVRLVL